MAKSINLRDLVPGDMITTLDGESLTVVDNPGDGAWVIAADPGGDSRPVYVNELVVDDE